jgi:hypothetical protein
MSTLRSRKRPGLVPFIPLGLSTMLIQGAGVPETLAEEGRREG